MHGTSVSGQPLAGIDHLRQSIRDILTTRRGTRVMCRDYGSRLPELVDRPMNPALQMDIYSATAEALDQWEPRFRLAFVRITQAAPGRITLRLEGEYLPECTAIVIHGIEVSA